MYIITIPRTDLTAEEVVQALRNGLGPAYNVLPGMRQTRAPFSEPEPGSPDTIVVGIGSNRVQKAQVSTIRASGHSEIQISPGGLIYDLLLNTVGIARKTHRVLSDPRERDAATSGSGPKRSYQREHRRRQSGSRSRFDLVEFCGAWFGCPTCRQRAGFRSGRAGGGRY